MLKRYHEKQKSVWNGPSFGVLIAGQYIEHIGPTLNQWHLDCQ